jgi:hypothetical protein
MIETGDRDPGEKESSESTEGAATDKTFKGSLMATASATATATATATP